MDSFILWKWKMAWIRSLVDQARKICAKENLLKEFQSIKKSRNGYPKNIPNTKRALSKETLTNDAIILSQKYRFSQIWKRGWTSYVNQMFFCQFLCPGCTSSSSILLERSPNFCYLINWMTPGNKNFLPFSIQFKLK